MPINSFRKQEFLDALTSYIDRAIEYGLNNHIRDTNGHSNDIYYYGNNKPKQEAFERLECSLHDLLEDI
jgi:hypothetical protein